MARLHVALLALCLCAATAAAAIAPASKCASTTPGMAGGWSVPQSVPDDVYASLVVSLVESSNSTAIAWVPCDDPAVTLEQACSQVVAGQNYQVVATLACPPPAQSSVQVEAVVYVPLPSANVEPQVTSLEILAVDGTAIVPPEVVV